MTEDDAKTKWCPFVRVYSVSNGTDDPNGSWNRHQTDGHKETLCMGSACMAWRWSRSPDTARFLNEGRAARNETPLPETGYCGLAGDV